MNEQYKEKFDKFIDNYKTGMTDGEQVGEVVAMMAQEFANYNMMLATASIKLNKISADNVNATDDVTGKPIAVSKADILTKATSEYEEVKKIKIALENIEQYINALKYLQKGILNEYSHMGNS